jgi:hypothetical protein
LLVLAGVIALAVLAGLQFLGGGLRSGDTASPATPARMEAEAEPRVRIESMTEVEPPVPAGPAAAPSGRGGSQSYVGVYECMVNGQRVVSDHPCGADAQARTLVVDRPDPRDVARQQQRTWAAQAGSPPRVGPPARSSVRSQVAPQSLPNQAACEAIDQAIANLNSRMRAGYTSAEGEWLRAEWHDLQKRREALDCGRR